MFSNFVTACSDKFTIFPNSLVQQRAIGIVIDTLALALAGSVPACDTGQLRPANHPLIRNNEIWFYYHGSKRRDITQTAAFAREYLDGRPICLAKLRLDGFCSLKGGIESGGLVTKPVEVKQSELRIKVDSWRGKAKAEILDPPMDGNRFAAQEPKPIPHCSDSTRLRDRGMPLDRTKELGGWKTMRMVERYLRQDERPEAANSNSCVEHIRIIAGLTKPPRCDLTSKPRFPRRI